MYRKCVGIVQYYSIVINHNFGNIYFNIKIVTAFRKVKKLFDFSYNDNDLNKNMSPLT